MFLTVSVSVSRDLDYYYRPQTKFAKVMFLHLSVSYSVHRGRGLQAHTQGGGWGVWLGRGLQAHAQEGPGLDQRGGGSGSQHALRQTPPPIRRLMLRAVRILLECILVYNFNFDIFGIVWIYLIQGSILKYNLWKRGNCYVCNDDVTFYVIAVYCTMGEVLEGTLEVGGKVFFPLNKIVI